MKIFRSFQTRVTLAFVSALLLLIGIGNLFLYQYSLDQYFEQMKSRLLTIAKTAVVSIDVDTLQKVPLNREGAKTEEFKSIARRLEKVRQANSFVKYIYTMAKTDKPGIWQFVVDPEPEKKNEPTSYPGQTYDASRFPEMLAGFQGPSVDKDLTIDEWGVTLSGYAPIYKDDTAVAILGVDMDAQSIFEMQKAIQLRVVFVFLIGVFVSIIFGVLISKSVTDSVEKLVEGTRKIASGDLEYKVKVQGKDEIGELARSFNEMAASLSESRKKLHDYFYRVVQAMIRSLEAKDHYTRGHSDRVGDFSEKIALEMGFSKEKAEVLKEAAEMHDIGKLGIHEDVLNKKGTLSETEWDAVHQHPVVGEEIMKPVIIDEEMLPVIRSHHEHYDGTGYPDGLKGDQISIFAQITSVADTYDAITSSRSYRAGLSVAEGISRLRAGEGTQFNPKVVEAFVRVLEKDKPLPAA